MSVVPNTDAIVPTDPLEPGSPVYLDCNATTPVDPVVLDEVIRYMRDEFGNAGSRTHAFGQRAQQRVNTAREEVAELVDASPDGVIFTSGATESNNLAILGLEQAGIESNRRHIVTTAIEHKAVLEPVEVLRKRGFEVTVVDPTSGGWVEPKAIAAAVRKDTLLVSVMAVNNETGVIQPIERIANILQDHDAYFHVDAAQAFGKLKGMLENSRIDMTSISGHKVYAPKGIGALVLRRRGYQRIPLVAQIVGGGQERGLRSGTASVALIAGLGTAAREAAANLTVRSAHCAALKGQLLSALKPLGAELNGDSNCTVAHTVNFSLPGIDSEAAIVALKDIAAISNGSACTSQRYEPSHVLLAMNSSTERMAGALRFSWSHLTHNPPWGVIAERLQRLRLSDPGDDRGHTTA